MAIRVLIPVVLAKLTKDQSEVQGTGSTIREIIDNMNREYPGIKGRLFEGEKFNRRVICFVNEEDVRYLRAEETPVKDGDVISIIPALSGGAV